jgi:hypothetical protein
VLGYVRLGILIFKSEGPPTHWETAAAAGILLERGWAGQHKGRQTDRQTDRHILG